MLVIIIIFLLFELSFASSVNVQEIPQDVLVYNLLPFLSFDSRLDLADTCKFFRKIVYTELSKDILQIYPELKLIITEPDQKENLVTCIINPCYYYNHYYFRRDTIPPILWSNSELFILALVSKSHPVLSDPKLAAFIVKTFVDLDRKYYLSENRKEITLKLIDNVIPFHVTNKFIMRPFLKTINTSRSLFMEFIRSNYYYSPQKPLLMTSPWLYYTNRIVLTHGFIKIFHYLFSYGILFFLFHSYVPLLFLVLISTIYSFYMFDNFLPF